MKVAVILGNRMKDDGTITSAMKKRLEMTLEIASKFAPDKIIVSGGLANPKAQITEALAMKNWLTANGIDQDRIITEDKSLNTTQNALYSVPLALSLGASEIILCTSINHMKRFYGNPVKLFARQLEGTDVVLTPYTHK